VFYLIVEIVDRRARCLADIAATSRAAAG